MTTACGASAAAVAAARANGSPTIDVVQAVARYVPVTLGHRYLGVPVAAEPGSFELTPDMLTYYGAPIDGEPATALTRTDGIIPDERQMYLWIKAAFQHFFNNVQKDQVVKVQGLRACRQLLAYLLREVAIQRQRLQGGQPVEDTMLTRLVAVSTGPVARACPAAGPRPSPGQRPANRRERHGDDRRGGRRPGRGHLPRDRFIDPAEGG